MTASSCAQVRECAPDLALGALTGPERAEVVAHLDGCLSCQALVGEYATVADTLLELVPAAQPPAALAPPVLAAMRPPAPRRRRHRIATLVAAAVLAITAGAGVLVAVETRDSGGKASTAASALHSAPMVGAGDRTVGRVVSTGDDPPRLAVSVDYWVADGSYQLAALDRNGRSVPVGSLQVAGGRGTWTGRAATVDHPVAVSVVDPSGSVVCRGRLA